ncbi:EscU/YscU/HrcU family type III secretion system export apparatus switch protein [Fonticella tunisiensis]|uniref:Flagellar biosynthesis protein n=1 Tax=Fonticella tunisiensis TaxID=1096341 RepID=A0A4R7KS50_9CLOT|nr:EscU/YscU/HrcU family type III secretion system export apparatus switch protein [Fonticella tunisiensis]TDT60912.1 flagellar biosynthesis protein [Fonticella tunisiensis]
MKKKAAALRYEKGYIAPKVTAIGFGHIAEKIIEEANRNNVPVISNEKLAESLSSLTIDQEIPSELYEAVAAVIAYIYSVNDKAKTI